MKNSSILLFICICSFYSWGQQDNIFTQWCFNHNTYNPALAGIKNYQELKLINRFQWVGFGQGTPSSHLLNYSTQLPSKRTEYLTPRHGLTFQFENDKNGPFGSNRLLVGYAFHRNFTQDARLSIGIRGGVTQLFFNIDELNSLHPDPVFNRNKTLYLPNVALGLWWNTKRYYIGLSLQQLANSKWNNLGTNSSFNTHFVFTGGTKFELTDKVTFLPNILISQTIANPIRIDLIGYFDFQNQFKLGMGLRNKESVLAMFQLRLNHQFFIGYSVDYITNGLNTSYLMTHEINFQFAGEHIRDTEKLSCPLF